MLADLPGGRAAPRELGWPFDDDLQLFAEDGRLTMHLASGDAFGKYSHALELCVLFFGMLFVGPGRLSIDGE